MGTAKDDTHGYRMGNQTVSVMAYADDIALATRGESELQDLLDVAGSVADWSGLQFKPAKCATLNLDGRARSADVDQRFLIQEEAIPILAEGQHYRHLGVPTGFRTKQAPKETIDKLMEDYRTIDRSLLAPWQKIDTASTFLNPRLDFILRAAAVEKAPIAEADHLLPSQGGAGLISFRDQYNILAVVHGFRLLTCPDQNVKAAAWYGLRQVVRRKLGRQPTSPELADYLSGSTEGPFKRDGGDIASLWSRVRKATREIAKASRVEWFWSETLKEVQLLISRAGEPEVARVPPAAR